MRVFPPLIVIEDRGQQACALASEADLVRHKEAEVENPVKEIIDQLAQGTTYGSLFEGDVYRKLRHLHGTAIPVYLGDIHLQRNFYCLGPERIIVHVRES